MLGDRFLQTGCDGTGGDMVVGGGGDCCGQLQVIWQKSKKPAKEDSEGVLVHEEVLEWCVVEILETDVEDVLWVTLS